MKIEKIIVFGAGAAGANTLLNLVSAHPELVFTVVDFDGVEVRNLGTQPYDKMDVKRPKVQALQRIVAQRFEKKIEAINKKIGGQDTLNDLIGYKGDTLAIDAFDNALSRNYFCKVLGPVLHIGFSNVLSGEVLWNELFTPMKESKSDSQIDVCQMAHARAFIQMLTGAAALIVDEFLTSGKKTNVYLDKQLKIRVF